jgi:hypothetical protein
LEFDRARMGKDEKGAKLLATTFMEVLVLLKVKKI